MSAFLTARAGLTHHDAQQRDLAAETLGDLLRTGVIDAAGAPDTRPTLEAFLNHPEPAVRCAAAQAIAELSGRSGL